MYYPIFMIQHPHTPQKNKAKSVKSIIYLHFLNLNRGLEKRKPLLNFHQASLPFHLHQRPQLHPTVFAPRHHRRQALRKLRRSAVPSKVMEKFQAANATSLMT